MNGPEQSPAETGAQNERPDIGRNLKAVAIDLFKKSQRLPPLSLILRKKKEQEQPPLNPPEGFEFADFYHL